MTNDPKNLPTYTNEEVASILTRALDRQHEGGRLSHDELLETAREIGVTTLEIEAAVADEVKARAELMVLEEARQRAARRFLRHLATFVVVSAALVVIDVQATGGRFWYFAVLAWGIGVGVHALKTFLPKKAAAKATATPMPSATPSRIEVRGAKMELRPSTPSEQSETRRRVS
ncbi:MAG: 2TM domain-containing protein [Minicystis sp.]